MNKKFVFPDRILGSYRAAELGLRIRDLEETGDKVRQVRSRVRQDLRLDAPLETLTAGCDVLVQGVAEQGFMLLDLLIVQFGELLEPDSIIKVAEAEPVYPEFKIVGMGGIREGCHNSAVQRKTPYGRQMNNITSALFCAQRCRNQVALQVGDSATIEAE